MFEQAPGLTGGFTASTTRHSAPTPSNVFKTSIVDFPTRSTMAIADDQHDGYDLHRGEHPPEFEDLFDGETIESIPAQLTFSSTFTVDAWGR
jgi:hypothetical protein